MSRYVPAGIPVVIVEDDIHVPDTVAAWLKLELEYIQPNHGAELFKLGVPCRRRLTRPAVRRNVFVDGNDASWDSPIADGPIALDETGAGGSVETEEREIEPAGFDYEAPRVLALLPTGMARWAYETFKAAELDSMFRLRDDGKPWALYVEELRTGMER